jgi:translation initiation factor 3 subunit J
MPDNWDDSDEDDWDVDDEQLNKNLGLAKAAENLPTFEDEEDEALTEKERQEKLEQIELKKKGTALAAKRRAQKDEKDELEIARKAMELEAELEASLSPDELRKLKQQQIEDADHALTDALFGNGANAGPGGGGAGSAVSGDKLVLKDIKDHLRHARNVSDAMKAHGKILLTSTFIQEVIQESKDLLDEDAITDIIKVCNALKNEKVQAAKRKVKGQAQKSKKVDKAAEAKARQTQVETFGDNDQYDDYDEMGANYEDAFF